MFNKKNPMRYFSGSTFARLPLYKLAAGGTAVVLTASIGLGAFAHPLPGRDVAKVSGGPAGAFDIGALEDQSCHSSSSQSCS